MSVVDFPTHLRDALHHVVGRTRDVALDLEELLLRDGRLLLRRLGTLQPVKTAVSRPLQFPRSGTDARLLKLARHHPLDKVAPLRRDRTHPRRLHDRAPCLLCVLLCVATVLARLLGELRCELAEHLLRDGSGSALRRKTRQGDATHAQKSERREAFGRSAHRLVEVAKGAGELSVRLAGAKLGSAAETSAADRYRALEEARAPVERCLQFRDRSQDLDRRVHVAGIACESKRRQLTLREGVEGTGSAHPGSAGRRGTWPARGGRDESASRSASPDRPSLRRRTD